jgi:hypothetical protein
VMTAMTFILIRGPQAHDRSVEDSCQQGKIRPGELPSPPERAHADKEISIGRERTPEPPTRWYRAADQTRPHRVRLDLSPGLEGRGFSPAASRLLRLFFLSRPVQSVRARTARAARQERGGSRTGGKAPPFRRLQLNERGWREITVRHVARTTTRSAHRSARGRRECGQPHHLSRGDAGFLVGTSVYR